MKRFAYLLSNNDGLPGIKKDVSDFRSYLTSCEGGAWNPNEVFERTNLSLSVLRSDLDSIKARDFDYVIFYYSGHGSYARGTRLYINETDDNIDVNEVFGLATRQLSVFDCCRHDPEKANEKCAAVCDEAINSSELMFQWCRKKYDRLVQGVPQQQVALYASQIGEYATATSIGSVYTQSLLSCAQTLSATGDLDAVTAHNACSMTVSSIALKHGVAQHPDCNVPFASRMTGVLPFAVKKPQLLFG